MDSCFESGWILPFLLMGFACKPFQCVGLPQNAVIPIMFLDKLWCDTKELVSFNWRRNTIRKKAWSLFCFENRSENRCRFSWKQNFAMWMRPAAAQQLLRCIFIIIKFYDQFGSSRSKCTTGRKRIILPVLTVCISWMVHFRCEQILHLAVHTANHRNCLPTCHYQMAAGRGNDREAGKRFTIKFLCCFKNMVVVQLFNKIHFRFGGHLCLEYAFLLALELC